MSTSTEQTTLTQAERKRAASEASNDLRRSRATLREAQTFMAFHGRGLGANVEERWGYHPEATLREVVENELATMRDAFERLSDAADRATDLDAGSAPMRQVDDEGRPIRLILNQESDR